MGQQVQILLINMAHSFIDKLFSLIIKNKIPAIIIVGILFLYTNIYSSELVESFYSNKDYLSSYKESKRILILNSANEKIQYIYAVSQLHIDKITDKSEAINILQDIMKLKDTNNDLACLSSYKLGLFYIANNNFDKAFHFLSFVFFNAKNKDLFLHSSCSLFFLNTKNSTYKKNNPTLFEQISSTKYLWTDSLLKDCKINIKKNKNSENFIVYFYRRNIRPAIGDRCVIEPSCSEYFRQSYIKHGIISFPMIADRFFREPGIAADNKKMITTENGLIKFKDLLTDHDFWMGNK